MVQYHEKSSVTIYTFNDIQKKWQLGKMFFFYYTKLELQFTTPRDRNWVVAKCLKILDYWLEWLNFQIVKSKMKMQNIYNIDKKSYAIGLIKKTWVLISHVEQKNMWS